MPSDPANSRLDATECPPRSAIGPPFDSPLSASDRAILRALLATDRPGPAPSPPSALATALAAAGLDELDLPLWFTQPHIQDYITAHRALEDFLDQQAIRAARRQGLELLRCLAHNTDASDATCHDLPSPRHSRAPLSPNPHPAATPTQQRLIATALLRAPALSPTTPARPRPRADEPGSSARRAPSTRPNRRSRALDPTPTAPTSSPHTPSTPAALADETPPASAPAPHDNPAIRVIDDAIARILLALEASAPEPPPATARPAVSAAPPPRDTG